MHKTTMQQLTLAWPLVMLLLLPASAPAETAVQAWAQRYHGPANGDNWGYAVTVDSSNNVIVTGYSAGSGSGEDYATIQYSSAGVPLWTNRYNGPGNYTDNAEAVAVDGNNDVIVTGLSCSSTNLSSSDFATLKYSSEVTGGSVGNGSYSDYATIKYSSAGLPLWTNRYDGPGNGLDNAFAVAVDHSGNVIVTGYSTGNGNAVDFATVKYELVSPSPPVLTGLALTNGSFQMEVDGVRQPGTLIIESFTDLAIWSPVFTNTTPTNVIIYTDPDGGNQLGRFYRARQSQ